MAMSRYLALLYGVGCHLLFLVVFAYMMGFVGNLLVPWTIDSATVSAPQAAFAIDMLLLAAFGLQHSLMARPWFKRAWTRAIPKPIERSTYVLASCAVLAVVMWQWQGIPTIVWDVQGPLLRGGVWCVFAAGWLMVPLVTLLISHFDLFGLRQVWLHLRGREYTSLPFREPSLYKRVRHPLYLGWTVAFWATPTMTVGHLLFASVLTVYMAVAAVFEERDLVAHFGRQYQDYQQRVPMFLPALHHAARRGSAVAQPAEPLAAAASIRSEVLEIGSPTV